MGRMEIPDRFHTEHQQTTMRSQSRSSLRLALYCFLGCFAVSPLARSAEPVQWEYRVIRIDDSRPEEKGSRTTGRSGGAEESLNKLGAEGWELVAVRVDASATRRAPIFYFKRPKTSAGADSSGAKK